MQYHCGIYGGSFNPLHLGHVDCIIKAANMCEKLIIVISDGVGRNEIDIRVKYRWVYQLTKHLPHVKLFTLLDEDDSKESYGKEQWEADGKKVRAFAGEPIDVVFCGSDYDENSFWKKCYPEAFLHIFPRNEISSSLIRSNVYEHWDMLPNVVKPYYVKKVLLIGGESTGKSTLTINLANYFNTNFLEEVGRELSEKSGTDEMMLPEDFTDILISHKAKEMALLPYSNKVLFEDTDCLITRFYIDFLEGKDKEQNAALADAIAGLNSYDLILFLEPDVKFVQDGGRSEEIAANREKYSAKIKEIFETHGFSYVSVSGSYEERYEQAVELTKKLFLTETK